jgi:thiol-disulfide isomerase/thioredoxin
MKPGLSRSRILALVVLAAAAVGIGVLSRNSLSSSPPVPRIVPLSESLGPVTVTAKDGTKVDLTALRGKTVVLHFWATWCPPCVDEMPGLVAYAKELSGDPSVARDRSVESFEIVTPSRSTAAELPVPRRQAEAGRLGTLKF